ncbi:hypothetical protein [Blastopirellula retiformator]|uniref:Uncharacterized protein n=1 Tax=Blastopirellula retiformator TaxID=2527970 RepID=A0A5C5UUM1_9BACT|nr:hypothetical protein [Blastopirellula retiformator]TWT29818.1 hypothetical protein Enr8_44730 [Blastopirellula retiformator]
MFARIAIGCLGWLACCSFAIGAEPPKLEDLIARMPVLSPDNERVKSCEFIFSLPGLGPFAYRAHVGWDRNRGRESQGMILSDPFGKVPICVAVHGKVFIYDIVRQRGILTDEQFPQVGLHLKTEPEERLQFNYGLIGDDEFAERKDLIKLDPGTFLTRIQPPKWNKLDAERWEMKASSASGDTKLTCLFDLSREYPLTKMQMFRESPTDPAIEIEVLSVNGAVDENLLTFPAEADLPKNLPILGQEAYQGLDQDSAVKVLGQLFIAHRAMRKPEVRKSIPIFDDVDWDAAELKYSEMAPALMGLAPNMKSDGGR